MKKFLAVLIAAGALLAPAVGGWSESHVTVQTGSYPLEWKTPEISKEFDPSYPYTQDENVYWIDLTAAGKDQTMTYLGLKSANAFTGRGGGFLVVVDESRGTGRGHDTGYLLVNKPDDKGIDLSKAVKATLQKSPKRFYSAGDTDVSMSMSAKPGELRTDIYLGEPPQQIVKRALVDGFTVLISQAGAKATPTHAIVTLRGSWYGTIKTSYLDFHVRASDDNGNGVYGDKLKPGWEDCEKGCGDCINIGLAKAEGESSLQLAEAAQFFGLYSIEVSKTGDRLDIKPYQGETGFLTVEARDSKGAKTTCENVSFYGHTGLFAPVDEKPARVPVGSYWCSAFIYVGESGKGTNRGIRIITPPMAVENDQTVKFTIGGPIHFEIAPGADAIRSKAGQDKEIETTVYAGKDILDFAMTGEFAATITDAKGKSVAKLHVSNKRSQVHTTHVFTIPKTLKRGSYTINVRLNAKPYQEPVSVKKKLVVE